MKFSLLSTFSIFCFVIVSHSSPIYDEQEAAIFLEKCGYLNEANGPQGKTGGVLGADAVSNAIKDFQRFVGLNVTGKLDQDTVVKMNSPRCCIKDIIEPSEPARRKRFVHADLCRDAKIDTITRTQSGTTYAFKGNYYFKVNLDGGIAEGFPRRISHDWGGLEGNLDASLLWPNGKIYFFKGARYWRFTGQNRDPGYPKLVIDGFEGIPDNLDAAIVWNGNGKAYFFKGSQYWRYDSSANPPVHSMYPLPINEWKGVPNNIDAAVSWDNKKTYFFKGDKYYRYDDRTSQVDPDPQYPLSTAVYWFGC